MALTGESKFRDVARKLEAAIAEGRWTSGRMPGLREIAVEYEVSVVTASRALHLLRDKGMIRSVHRSGNYLVQAPAIATGSEIRKWGLCFRTTPGPWQRAAWSVTMGGFETVSSRGRDLFVSDLFSILDDTDASEIARQVRRAVDEGISGVFLLPSRISEASRAQEERLLGACRESGMPVVLIERNLRGDARTLEWDLIATDDVEGGYQCAAHLIQTGRERVAFIWGGPTSTHNDRLAGYLLALSRLGGSSPAIVLEHRHDIPSRAAHQELAERLVESGADGVVCYQDTVAIGLVLEMLARRVRIPEDLAIVGYDDLPIGNSFSIGLTTYAHDIDRIAAEAVRMIEHRLDDPSASPIKVVVPGRLIVRESSLPAR